VEVSTAKCVMGTLPTATAERIVHLPWSSARPSWGAGLPEPVDLGEEVAELPAQPEDPGGLLLGSGSLTFGLQGVEDRERALEARVERGVDVGAPPGGLGVHDRARGDRGSTMGRLPGRAAPDTGAHDWCGHRRGS
jgi:hypothetical protein